jgi:hypothetical protein
MTIRVNITLASQLLSIAGNETQITNPEAEMAAWDQRQASWSHSAYQVIARGEIS